MITNISRLSDGKFGVLVDVADFYVSGSSIEDADYDICAIYKLVDGGYIAEAYGMLFPVEETNWNGNPLKFRRQVKRGKHSRSNNKKSYREKLWDMSDELPF